MTTTTQSVRDIALEIPSSIRVFEKYGIDYCCGGRVALTEACAAKNIEVDAVNSAAKIIELERSSDLWVLQFREFSIFHHKECVLGIDIENVALLHRRTAKQAGIIEPYHMAILKHLFSIIEENDREGRGAAAFDDLG